MSAPASGIKPVLARIAEYAREVETGNAGTTMGIARPLVAYYNTKPTPAQWALDMGACLDLAAEHNLVTQVVDALLLAPHSMPHLLHGTARLETIEFRNEHGDDFYAARIMPYLRALRGGADVFLNGWLNYTSRGASDRVMMMRLLLLACFRFGATKEEAEQRYHRVLAASEPLAHMAQKESIVLLLCLVDLHSSQVAHAAQRTSTSYVEDQLLRLVDALDVTNEVPHGMARLFEKIAEGGASAAAGMYTWCNGRENIHTFLQRVLARFQGHEQLLIQVVYWEFGSTTTYSQWVQDGCMWVWRDVVRWWVGHGGQHDEEYISRDPHLWNALSVKAHRRDLDLLYLLRSHPRATTTVRKRDVRDFEDILRLLLDYHTHPERLHVSVDGVVDSHPVSQLDPSLSFYSVLKTVLTDFLRQQRTLTRYNERVGDAVQTIQGRHAAAAESMGAEESRTVRELAEAVDVPADVLSLIGSFSLGGEEEEKPTPYGKLVRGAAHFYHSAAHHREEAQAQMQQAQSQAANAPRVARAIQGRRRRTEEEEEDEIASAMRDVEEEERKANKKSRTGGRMKWV